MGGKDRMFEVSEALCAELDAALEADGCLISRAIGDVLVQIAEHVPAGRTLQLGRGFLVSDFPLTRHVLESGESCPVTVADPEADQAEVSVLHDLGLGSVLMLALAPGEGRAWGLVEVYRAGSGGFATREIERAEEIVTRAAASL